MAIDNVLKTNTSVGAANVEILKKQQVVVDKEQKAFQSFKHSMTGLERGHNPANEITNYIAQAESFIREQLTKAIEARKSGSFASAFTNLGTAIHPLQDATSPAHKGFQLWRDNETLWSMLAHVRKERLYPLDKNDPTQVAYRAELEGVVRWAFDIYTETVAMPARFFNPGDGLLLLPQSYR
jgi:hypothetical protein